MSGDLATHAPRVSFPELLDRSKHEIAKVLPPGMDLERVMRVALTAYRMDHKIHRCNPLSILAAVMKALELGLEPGGAYKHAYLIPYKDECTLQVGYLGLLELARRSGAFHFIEARLVYEKDEINVTYEPDLHLYHRPVLVAAGAAIGAYATGTLAVGGARPFVWMERAEIEKVRMLSQSPDRGAWAGWWGEMAKKVVLKRFLKTQPLSPQLAEVLSEDDLAGRDREQGLTWDPAGRSRPADLAARLRARVAEADLSAEDYGGEGPTEQREREPGEEG